MSVLSFVADQAGKNPHLAVAPRADGSRLSGKHLGPAALAGARVAVKAEDVVFDPYANSVLSLEVRIADGVDPRAPSDLPPEVSLYPVGEVLKDPLVQLHPAERYFLRKFAQDGVGRFALAQQPNLWQDLRGIAGDQCGPDLWIIPLRTPTLPPAKHTNMVVLGGVGLVVDPGAHAQDEREKSKVFVRRLQEEMGPLQAIWLTHHHPDHAGGAAWLSKHAELPIWAHATTASLLEKQLRVDRVFAHGDSIPLPTGENSEWTAVHTPGHAAGHLCLFHESTRRLIAGDMMAGVGTILVDPADGDMATYIQSLENLAAMNPSAAVPAHGPILCEATAMLKFYVGHRLFREQKIYDAISDNAEAMYDVLLRAYDDAPPEVLPIAALSLESHVRKLEQEGRVARNAQGLVARC